MGSIGDQATFSPREIDRLRALAADPTRRYGTIVATAKAMGRSAAAVQSKVTELKRQPRPRFSLPGVMIDDWGQSHATIIAEMRDGIR